MPAKDLKPSLALSFMVQVIGRIINTRIGGGSFTVPYLNYAGLKMVNSIGTASACGVIISFFASLGFVLTGLGEDQALEKSIGLIYWPALVGSL